MNDIDLIPLDYRRSLQLRGWFQKFVIVVLGVVVCMLATKFGLDHVTRLRYRELAEIQAAEERSRLQQIEIARLGQEQDDAHQQLSILEGLRGGNTSQAIFRTVDDAFAEGLWFNDWTFRRAGELVENDGKAVQAGYFVVLPLEEPNQKQKAWHMQTHMEIRGQALDHSTLAKFVSRLLDDPRIEQVRVVNTRMRRYTSMEVVDFELAVIVRSEA